MLERRALDHGIVALVPPALEAEGFLVAFTERTGGTSPAPFASLNLGFTSDDPERVRRNRRRLCAALGLSSFVRGHQVHGTTVAAVSRADEGAGFDSPEDALPGSDALSTTEPGLALSILTADCVPAALVSPAERRLTVVHAGWRGIAAGILARAVATFADPGSVRAVVGPSVGPDHYEVGEDVVAAVARSTEAGPVVAPGRPRPRVHLGATVERILRERGVRRVERDETCTACEEDRFFSYRRDGTTGRQALVAIRLTEP